MDLKYWVVLPLAAAVAWRVYRRTQQNSFFRENDSDKNMQQISDAEPKKNLAEDDDWRQSKPFSAQHSLPPGVMPCHLHDPSFFVGEYGLQSSGEIEMCRQLCTRYVNNNFQPSWNSRAANI